MTARVRGVIAASIAAGSRSNAGGVERHADRHAAGGEDEDLVEEPRRREEDDLVARLDDRPERDRERREPAVGHRDVGRVPVEAGAARSALAATAACDFGSLSL